MKMKQIITGNKTQQIVVEDSFWDGFWEFIFKIFLPCFLLGAVLLGIVIGGIYGVYSYIHPYTTVQVYYDNGKKEVYRNGRFDASYGTIDLRNRTTIRVPKNAKVVVEGDK